MKIGFAHKIGVSQNKIIDFYEKHWERKLAFVVPSFYDWQFFQPPSNTGKDHVCVSIDHNNNILGAMGLNIRPFINLKKKKFHAAELTTWVVSPDSRGKGVGTATLSFLHEEFEVLLGSGISDMAIPLYLKHNFQYIATTPRFFKVWNYHNAKPYLSTDVNFIENHTSIRLPVPIIPYTVDKVQCYELYDIFDSIPYTGFLRDKEHLFWRFDSHPIFDYQGFRISCKNSPEVNVAALVLRHERLPDGFHLVHILECIGNRDGIHVALSFLEDYCRANQVDAADFLSSHHTTGQHFRKYGWWSIVDEPFVQLTHLFHPPELRVPATTSLVYYGPQDTVSDIYDCYITKADVDMDRPTYETYSLDCLD